MTAMGFAPIACLILLVGNSFGLGKLAFVEVLVTVLALLFSTLTIVAELLFTNYSGEMELYHNYLISLENLVQSRKLTSSNLCMYICCSIWDN